eukprot:tig00020610_g12078.t1
MQPRVFKSSLFGDVRRFALEQPTYANLRATIERIHGLQQNGLQIKYVDEEGDEVLISSEEELVEAIRISEVLSNGVVKLKLEPAQQAARDAQGPQQQPAAVPAAPQPAPATASTAPGDQATGSAARPQQSVGASLDGLRESISAAYGSLSDELTRQINMSSLGPAVSHVQASMRAIQNAAPGLVQGAIAAASAAAADSSAPQRAAHLAQAAQLLGQVPALVGAVAGPAINNVLSSLPNTQEGWRQLAQQSAEQAQRLSAAANTIAAEAGEAARRAAGAAGPVALEALGRVTAAAAASPAARAGLAAAAPSIASLLAGVMGAMQPQPQPQPAQPAQPAQAAAFHPAAPAAPPAPAPAPAPAAGLYPQLGARAEAMRARPSDDALIEEAFAELLRAQNAAAAVAAPAAAAAPPAAGSAPAAGGPGAPMCSFRADVTIPDGTTLSPGQEFTKIWRLANTGPCDWAADWALTFSGGHPLGAEVGARVPLGRVVPPGQEIEVPVCLRAPLTPGEYRGEWRMSTAAGPAQPFGARVWVSVRVAPGGNVNARPAPPPGTSAVVFEALLGQLAAMGFEDAAANAEALRTTGCDLAAAVDRLAGP